MWFGVGALIFFIAHVSVQFLMGKFGSRGKKVEEKIVGDSMLNQATANGTNNGIEVGCIMNKNNSILSESTVQEELESPNSEEVAKQSPKVNGKKDGKTKGDFQDVSLDEN